MPILIQQGRQKLSPLKRGNATGFRFCALRSHRLWQGVEITSAVMFN